MQIKTQGTGMELTEAIKSYAEEKAEGLTKFFDKIISVDIDVGMDSHHHNKGDVYYAEMNVSVPGDLVRVRKESDDLYKAIDKVKDHLKVELQKMKEKKRGRDKEDLRDNKVYEM